MQYIFAPKIVAIMLLIKLVQIHHYDAKDGQILCAYLDPFCWLSHIYAYIYMCVCIPIIYIYIYISYMQYCSIGCCSCNFKDVCYIRMCYMHACTYVA